MTIHTVRSGTPLHTDYVVQRFVDIGQIPDHYITRGWEMTNADRDMLSKGREVWIIHDGKGKGSMPGVGDVYLTIIPDAKRKVFEVSGKIVTRDLVEMVQASLN